MLNRGVGLGLGLARTLLARIINNDLVIHRQVKTSDIISRRFGDFMTPLSRLQMRIKLKNARSRVTIVLSCQRDALHQTINTEFERVSGFYRCSNICLAISAM